MKRKRKTGKREPNGRLSRQKADVAVRVQESEADVKSVVINARLRQGVPLKWADTLAEVGRPNVGTIYGLMRLRGELDEDQFQAALKYIQKRQDWLRAIKAQGGSVYCESPSAASLDDPRAYEAWYAKTKETWLDILDVFQELSNVTRSPIKAAVDQFCVVGHYVEHMVGDLRLGLNALDRYFSKAEKKAA